MTKSNEKQIEWVMNEVSKIINQAHKKKYDCVNVWQGLNQTAIEYGFDCAPTNTNATMFTLMNLVDKLKYIEEEIKQKIIKVTKATGGIVEIRPTIKQTNRIKSAF